MRSVRRVLGFYALACLVVALNVLLLEEDLFMFWVVAPLLAGLLGGMLWLVLLLMGVAWSQETSNRLHSLNAVLASVLFFGICVVVFAFARYWNKEWDLTAEGLRSLAPQTVQVLESLQRDVSVVGLFPRATGDSSVEAARDKTRRFLARCEAITPRLHVEFLDPQEDIVRFSEMNLTRMSKQGTVVIRCGDRPPRVIPLQGTHPRLEERDFTNALVNVVRDAQVKVCFLTGHSERRIISPLEDATGCSLLKGYLEGEAYQPEEMAIQLTHPSVPGDCDILVINNPESDLHPREIAAIQEYLDRGGRMLVLLDSQRRVETKYRQIEHFRPWLEERYGIVIGYDLAISASAKLEMVLSPNLSLFENTDSPEFHGCYNYEHPITRGFEEQMLLQPARTVTLKDKLPPSVVGRRLLRTLPDTWAETDFDLLFSEKRVLQDPDEQEGPLDLAVAVVAGTDASPEGVGRTRDARIVVVGNAMFASNSQLIRPAGNLNFLLNAVAWLSESDELIAIRPAVMEDPPIILTDGQEQAVAWIATLGILQIILVAGLVVYQLRRKYE